MGKFQDLTTYRDIISAILHDRLHSLHTLRKTFHLE